MRNAYIAALYDLARADERILALVADNGAIVYDKYRRDFSDRFINFGIAEANMVSVAAGLAACGKIPFAYTIAGFLTMKAFEQIRNDLCLQKMNVKLIGIGAGFVYSDLGPTHHTVEDLAMMRTLPGMTIFSPADAREARKATFAAAQIEGPVYLRLATGGTPDVYKEDYNFEVGRGVTLTDGSDITIIATGTLLNEALPAADSLQEQGVSVRLLNIHTIKPIDEQIILKAAAETRAILTVEEHSIYGGLGGAVAEVILENHTGPVRFKRLGLKAFPSGYGTYDEMKQINGLSRQHIADAARRLLETQDGEIIRYCNTLA
ncbi:MAG: transketolase family protein [Sedimentisphaerales bacterium]|nr:transketolase family protein [Sedimentisphaerales bacterium]